MILGLVRSYSIPVRDDRVRRLITWYVDALQEAIDLIWGNIEWRYSFLKLVKRSGKLIDIMGLKIHISMILRDKRFRKSLRESLWRSIHRRISEVALTAFTPP